MIQGYFVFLTANNRKMIWIKRDSQGDYYFSPKTKNQDNEGNLAEIESWTVILEKGISYPGCFERRNSEEGFFTKISA